MGTNISWASTNWDLYFQVNPDQQVGVKVEEKSILAASVRKNSRLPPNLLDMREHILERHLINAAHAASASADPTVWKYTREYIL